MPVIVPETDVRYEFPGWPDHLPYPLEAFPPIMRHAIREVSDCLEAPVPLAASAALGAVSLASQNFVNVQCPGYEPSSCALFLWTISESSAGKSEVERRFLRAILQFEEDERKAVEAEKSDFEADLKCWHDDDRELEKRYRKAKSADDKEALKLQRRQHAKAKPLERRARILRYTEMTPQQITEALDQFGAVGIMCADAGDVVKLETFRQTTLLNGLWSGESRRVGRVGGDRTTEAPRLTISMFLQESEFQDFIRQRGRAAVGNGLWARFLIAQPMSFQGSGSGVDDEHFLNQFNARIASILQQTVPASAKRETLVLSKDAKRYWTCYRDGMKKAAGDLRRTAAEKKFLLKLAQQASRIAALFHYFSRDAAAECISSGSLSAAAAEATVALLSVNSPQDHAGDSGELLPAQSEVVNRPTESRGEQADETGEAMPSQFDGSGLDGADRPPVRAGEANERAASEESQVAVSDRAGRTNEIADGSREIHANECENSAEVTQPPQEISGQTMLDAISLCDWFMCEYMKVMGRQEPHDATDRRVDPRGLNGNGEKLLGWVYKHYDRIVAEQNSECVKLDYAKFQNSFSRMGRENILNAMEWLGQQQGFRLEYGPKGGMYLCCSQSGNFCNSCKSPCAYGQLNVPDARATQRTPHALFVNGGSPSLGRQNQVDTSRVISGHSAPNFDDSTEIVALNKVDTGSRRAEIQGRESHGAIDAKTAYLDQLTDAAAGELSD